MHHSVIHYETDRQTQTDTVFYTLLFEAGISDGLDRGKLVKTDTFPNRSVLQSVLNVNNIWRRHDFSHYSVINFARYVENLSPAEGVRALPSALRPY